MLHKHAISLRFIVYGVGVRLKLASENAEDNVVYNTVRPYNRKLSEISDGTLTHEAKHGMCELELLAYRAGAMNQQEQNTLLRTFATSFLGSVGAGYVRFYCTLEYIKWDNDYWIHPWFAPGM